MFHMIFLMNMIWRWLLQTYIDQNNPRLCDTVPFLDSSEIFVQLDYNNHKGYHIGLYFTNISGLIRL